MKPDKVATAERTLFRRFDHVAIAVRDIQSAERHYAENLGLRVVHREELETPPVTLVYLDAGNTYIQLLSPRQECELSHWLDENGEGLHHICFSVDDVPEAIEELSEQSPPFQLGQGRGRLSAFVPDGRPFGVLIECTEFRPDDVHRFTPRDKRSS